MTGTANMNLHHCRYNLDGWIKASQESSVNVNNINQGVVYINVSDPTYSNFLRKKKCYMSWRVVLIQQFSLKAGLKRFGKEGEAAATKDLTQHNDMQKYFPLYPKALNAKQHTETLVLLMFLVENRNWHNQG